MRTKCSKRHGSSPKILIWPVSSPAYYLAGHGIEEAFKAYLRARGSSLKELRCIGHNLEHALGAAVSHGIESLCTLTSQDKAMVAVLNPYYKAKHYEYRVTGYQSLPQISDLLSFGQRLLAAIKPICEASVGVHALRSIKFEVHD